MQHADEVVHVSFPARGDSPRIVQPSEEALDDPAAFRTPQNAPVLGGGPDAPGAVRRNQIDADGGELRVERVAVVRAIADQARRVRVEEAVRERGADEPNFIW